MSDDKQLEDLNKVLSDLREFQEKAKLAYDQSAEDHWNSMTKEDQLKSFYSVCKRMHKGEIIDRGTYRYVLYEIFGFGPESYGVGMSCGYMNIHNSIVTVDPDKSSNED